MNKKGQIIIISGFSGVGKGTVVKKLREKYDNYYLSVSATTRNPRPEDIPEVTYHFTNNEAFEKLIADDMMIEYANYGNNYYGTRKAPVEQNLAEGKDVILEIEVQGAKIVKEKYPEAVSVYIIPPNVEEWKRRLVERDKKEKEEVIRLRMQTAVKESAVIHEYDYVLVNDDLMECVDKLHGIVEAEKCRTEFHLDMLKTLEEDVKRIVKGE